MVRETGHLTMHQVRARAALNLAKACALRDAHRPNDDQAVEMLSRAQRLWDERQARKYSASAARGVYISSDHSTISPASWRRWLEPKPPLVIRPSSFQKLDELLGSDLVSLLDAGVEVDDARLGFFEAMVCGGLLARFPASANGASSSLLVKADAYRPYSALHVHLDAIEVCSYASSDPGSSEWRRIKVVAAERIQRYLHDRWNLRTGSIYGRPGVAASGQAKPDAAVFSPFSHEGPDRIHALLFSLISDKNFVLGPLLSDWALDMATAALALNARAWADKEVAFASRHPVEEHFWCSGFDSLLFTNDPLPLVMKRFGMISSDAWQSGRHGKALVPLLRAKRTYTAFLKTLGLTRHNISSLVRAQRVALPLEFLG